METTRSDESGGRAAELFAAYRVEDEGGTPSGFEQLVSAHPELEPELRDLYANWHLARRALAREVDRTSFGGALARELAPGLELAGFRLVRPLGRGGMGEVWEARELALERDVALKLVRSDRASPRARELMRREAVALARIHHPGIVTIYAVGEEHGRTWINQELVRGNCTLEDALLELRAEKELPLGYARGVARLFLGIARALAAAHEVGVVHRDLKPSNVLIGPDDEPKVADFGLAVLREGLDPEETGHLLGTALYMSPEQVAGLRYGIDGRSDVFSLGAMLYEALALRRPFESKSADQGAFLCEVLEAIATEDPPPLRSTGSEVPKKLARIAERCLAKPRRRRYQAMAEVALDLCHFLAGEPLEVASGSGSDSGREGGAYDVANAKPGQRIGGYALVRPLGRGAQGEVWEAEQEETGGRVALKLLSVEGRSEGELERFQREARAGAKRIHPGLIHVYAAGFEGAVHWIAMELVEGGRTLRDVIQSARELGQRSVVIDPAALASGELFPSRALLRERYRRIALFFAELAEALEKMHAAGILHRDLKPANVLVTNDLSPKVADFGSARLEGERTLYKTGELAGTPRYMSPEQLNPKLFEADARSDVFALGVMLYEVLALAHPFEGDDRVVQQKILLEEPPPLRVQVSELPRELSVIAHKCLEKQAKDRYGSMGALALDLRRFLADEPIEARPPGAWQRARQWVRRHPTKSAVGAVAGFFFALVAVLAIVALEQAATARLSADSERVARAEAEREKGRAQESAQVARRAEEEALLQQGIAKESERRALASEARALEEREDVLSLSARRRLDDLVEEAGELWPAYPERIPRYREWLERARVLIEGSAEGQSLAQHREKLGELRARALEPTAEERERARGEPPELGRLEGRIGWSRRMLAIRETGSDPLEGVPLELGEVPKDAKARELDARAWALVDPEREGYGREREGLALAQRALSRRLAAPALELAWDEEVPALANTHAWALFANGRDEEALAESERALEAAPEARRMLRGHLERMRGLVLERAGEEGLARLRRVVAALESELQDELLPPKFASEEDGWWYGELSALVGRLEAFRDPKTGLFSAGISPEHGWGIERRLEYAEGVVKRGAGGEEAQRRWEEALASIADRAECPAYGGLELEPELGLLPIGRDPRSLLWEFWHVVTGEEPARDPATGELVLTEKTGLVFVLIPGGSFLMGAQRKDPSGQNYDPEAQSNESPVHEVVLDPFFLSKYEVTQGQWLYFASENLSSYDGSERLLHPVERVSWEDCDGGLRPFGLRLPTEAQWEYAARAGTSTPWWTGAKEETLFGAAHLQKNGTVAVGGLRPNAFGLHDVHGNVWEWCRDIYEIYRLPVVKGDGEHQFAGGSACRVYRGGSWRFPADNARSANRYGLEPGFRGDDLGFRPARVITD